MQYWVTCPADVEEYVRDERKRPRDYEEHFYPCYIVYEGLLYYPFYDTFYFLNESREQAIAMRRRNLTAYIKEKHREIKAAEHALEELDKY